MPKERYSPEEIVAGLRQVDVLVGQGKPIGEAVKADRGNRDHLPPLAA
jgi:hypothetical protein